MKHVLCATLLSLALLNPSSAGATGLEHYTQLQGWLWIAEKCQHEQPQFQSGYWGIRKHWLEVTNQAWETSFRNRFERAGIKLSSKQFQRYVVKYRLQGQHLAQGWLIGADCKDGLPYGLELFLKEDIFFDTYRAASDGELDMEDVLQQMNP
ncbi:hypothetical protein [Ferrimonas sp. SCSIO 43195]|uniref:hypothetical protein n=1 Tax=Ferrimonas sp. SCSIO 43195 TaxID=2822844 RepID=UPI002074B00D|nr:hypothetical protein [Ferrimonas sp. SCSIO 43195]USD35978.1 hypothetical protein J8Z22_13115 [Ferrimonas sp. SCSIO 43195]